MLARGIQQSAPRHRGAGVGVPAMLLGEHRSEEREDEDRLAKYRQCTSEDALPVPLCFSGGIIADGDTVLFRPQVRLRVTRASGPGLIGSCYALRQPILAQIRLKKAIFAPAGAGSRIKLPYKAARTCCPTSPTCYALHPPDLWSK